MRMKSRTNMNLKLKAKLNNQNHSKITPIDYTDPKLRSNTFGKYLINQENTLIFLSNPE